MSRLLIIACSQRKSKAKGLVRAIDRYDGPAFLVLRKYLRDIEAEPLEIVILSAKFGLIASDEEIPNYDCRLTRNAATKLQPKIREALRSVLNRKLWKTVGICAGADYRIALGKITDLVAASVPLKFVEGGQGSRLRALRNWLHSVDQT